MIRRLKGVLDELGDDWALIDVNGVGYQVFCSLRTLSRFAVGEAVVVEIETHVREDHIHLYGFADADERDWFKLLTTVQGVGNRVGLAILSVLGPDELMQAVAAADKAAVSCAPGVGPKLAARIVSELKDKVGGMALGKVSMSQAATSTKTSSTGAVSEAASALVNLGYGPSEALTAVSHVSANLGDDAGVEELIRDGLRELAPTDARAGG